VSAPGHGPADDRLMDHQYDGIQEYDNPLPTWWKLIFYATILVVPLYYWDPLGIGVGPGREKVYEQDMAAFAAAHPQDAGPSVSSDVFVAMSRDRAKVADGKTVFATTCVSCHRPHGGGLIGPNLADDFRIHGGTPTQIHLTISEGVPAKVMPPWGKMLKPEQVDAVTAYVISIYGSNPVNPKAPEGVKAAADSVPAATAVPAEVKKGM
jgi:cytochrome c oxidase cbb3-type subunit 3